MLERQAGSHDKQEKIERDKVKKALMKGNVEAAKIHAENAIRHHSESLNCRRMAARVDGVQARVANSAAQRQVKRKIRRDFFHFEIELLDGSEFETNGDVNVESDGKYAVDRNIETDGEFRKEFRRS